MSITCLHTAQGHVATFEGLLRAAGWGGDVVHLVHPDLLTRAQVSGIAAVQADVADIVAAHQGADALLCSCSTLGPLIDALATGDRPLVRIDRPMMETAVGCAGRLLVVICLASTQTATLGLLQQCAAERGRVCPVELLLCAAAWPLFEAGNMPAFLDEIAGAIRGALDQMPEVGAVILGQASMMGAAALLQDLDVPVLSSPRLAVGRAIERARQK
ncbi:MAG: hypothetical protein ACJAVM_003238 [Sulfitobacter sp.]|jgi:hypothetical protein